MNLQFTTFKNVIKESFWGWLLFCFGVLFSLNIQNNGRFFLATSLFLRTQTKVTKDDFEYYPCISLLRGGRKLYKITQYGPKKIFFCRGNFQFFGPSAPSFSQKWQKRGRKTLVCFFGAVWTESHILVLRIWSY